MKIATVVGARPQFIKAAMVSKKLRMHNQEILIHTGQHYDKNMSDIFFEELEIPKPDYNLGISGGSHAEMTGKMLIELEKVFLKEKPDALLVYGDTNSTLAAALAAVKIHLPICHVEAGVRTRKSTNPEEINRICTDHISTTLLTCTEESKKNLDSEGLGDKAEFVGDLMYDAFLFYKDKAEQMQHKLQLFDGSAISICDKFYYLTCHREENTINEKALYEILVCMNTLEYPTIYPVHPRNKQRAEQICRNNQLDKIILCEPVGYLTSIYLVMHAQKVVTDSGGLQREAFFAKKQCITMLDFVVWPEIMVDNRNQLCTADSTELHEKLNSVQTIQESYEPFGNGNAAQRIVDCIEEILNNKKGNKKI